MSKIGQILTRTGIFYTAFIAGIAHAAPTEIGAGAETAKPDGAETSLVASFARIANVLIFLVGAIAVLVLILGGLTYVTSTGDPARVKRAKDTILYGIVGVVVAILAYALVNFIVGVL